MRELEQVSGGTASLKRFNLAYLYPLREATMASKVRLPSVLPFPSPAPVFLPLHLTTRCRSLMSQYFVLSGGNEQTLPLACGVPLGVVPCGDHAGAFRTLSFGVQIKFFVCFNFPLAEEIEWSYIDGLLFP